MKSAFGTWFTAQFGKRPSRKTWHELREDVMDCKYKLVEAETLLERMRLWDEWRNAAMKAWVARMALHEKKDETE